MHISVVIPNFNNASSVIRCARSLLSQVILPGTRFTLTVVDDGSTDDSAAMLRRELDGLITLIVFPENRGRCSARNAGATAHDADVLLFVDSDCVAADELLISHHSRAIAEGSDVVFGEVATPGADFWSRLQEEVSARRKRAFANGEHWVFTTANVSIRKSVFDAAAGFDVIFNHHGFEDRDLFIRLAANGARVGFCSDARVIHQDTLTLRAVSQKFERLGRHAAASFASRHPEAYRTMGQSRLDARQHPWLGLLDALTWPFVKRIGSGPGEWLEWGWLPFRVRTVLARAVYGLSFLHGTRTSHRR